MVLLVWEWIQRVNVASDPLDAAAGPTHRRPLPHGGRIQAMKILRPIAANEIVHSGLITDSDEYATTVTFRQNAEVGDHWLIEPELRRWRSKAELAQYLRLLADIAEKLP